MGGSRRRLKRNAPKVRVGVQKHSKKRLTPTPLEISGERPQLEKRLGLKVDWKPETTLNKNYEACGLVVNPNAHITGSKFPRMKTKEEQVALDQDTFSDDDELRAGCNEERKTGRALPPRLSTHQRDVMKVLLAAHGDNYDAMVLDTTLNKMQHSAGKLQLMATAFHHWGADSKHDFKGPNKPYKRL